MVVKAIHQSSLKSLFLDVDIEAVPPMWPLTPSSLNVEAGVYELRAVPFSSIAMITSRVIKVRFLRSYSTFSVL